MKRIWTIVITAAATAAIVGGGTWYLIDSHAKKDAEKLQAEVDTLNQKLAEQAATSGTAVTSGTTTTTGATVTDETASWKTYTDTSSNFYFKYPNNYSVMLEKSTSGDSWLDITPDKTHQCPAGDACSGTIYKNQIEITHQSIAIENKNLTMEEIFRAQHKDSKSYEYILTNLNIGNKEVLKVVWPCSAVVDGETVDLGGVDCGLPYYQLSDGATILNVTTAGTVIDINTFLSTLQFTK